MSPKFPPPENQKQKTTSRDIVIDYTRQVKIRELLQNEFGIQLPQYLPEDFWSLEAKKGKFPKRLKKYIKSNYGVELPNEIMGVIGDLIRMYRPREEIIWDVNYTLDWAPGDFGDDGSCFWGSNRKARDIIRSNGGFAFRIYDPETGRGKARAWVYGIEPGIWVLWNGYGYDTETMASFLAHILGEEYGYKEVMLSNNGTSSDLVYINGGFGYVVGPKDLISKHDYLDLEWGTDYVCRLCSNYYNNDEGDWIGEEFYCKRCVEEYFVVCNDCGKYVHKDYTVAVQGTRLLYCLDCFKACDGCGKQGRGFEVIGTQEKYYLCDDCKGKFAVCTVCNSFLPKEWLHKVTDQEVWCHSCKEKYAVCSVCRKARVRKNEEKYRMGDHYYCRGCVATSSHIANCWNCGQVCFVEGMVKAKEKGKDGYAPRLFCSKHCAERYLKGMFGIHRHVLQCGEETWEFVG